MINNFNFFKFFYFLKKGSLINNFYKKNIVFLKTLQIKKKFVIFEGNLKSECFIRIDEFLENGFLEIKEGDYVEAFLSNIENNYGNIILSRIKFKNFIFWRNIFFLKKKKIFVKGRFLNKIKGGYSIIMKNFKCFLPFSCSDKKISNFSYYLEKDLYFLISNFDFFKKNIVLSRKLLIFKVVRIKRKIFFNKVNIGSIVKGIVKNMTNYCAFIDIGYLDCVVFFKNLTWGNYRYFTDFLKVGQSVLAIILKIDKKKHRVFLGLKQLFNPWKKIFLLRNSIKYVRVLRINTNNIYVILGKNIIASVNNPYNKGVFKFLKINSYKKIKIKKFNFKRKRINFNFFPPLA